MAITFLSAGQNTTPDGSSATNAQSVTVPSGSNRRAFVCVQLEGAATPPETVSSVTLGGQSLAKVTDGTTTAEVTDSVERVVWWELKEANFPTTGSQNLVATLSAARQCTVGWMFASGCDQSADVHDVTTNSTATTSTSLSSNFDAVPGGLVVSGLYTNDLVGFTPPTFQAAGTLVASTGGVSAAWPAHTTNDIGLLFVETGAQAVTTPSGWNALITGGNSGGTNTTLLSVFWRRAASSSESAASVADPGDHCVAQIVTFRGVRTTGNPHEAQQGSIEATSDTSGSIAGVTTLGINRLIVVASSYGNDSTTDATSSWTNATLGTVTERVDGHGSTSGNGGGFGVATGTMASQGTTGTTTFTFSTAASKSMVCIALVPPDPVNTQTATIAGSLGTNEWVTYNNQGGAFVSGDQRILTTESGTQTIAWAYTSTSRAAGVAFVVGLPGTAIDVNGSSTLGSLGSAGSVDKTLGVGGSSSLSALGSVGAALKTQLLSGTGSLATALGSSGAVVKTLAVVGNSSLGALGSAGIVGPVRDVSGASMLGALASAGSLTLTKALTGASALTSLVGSGAFQKTLIVSGASALGSLLSSGTVALAKLLLGAGTLGSSGSAGSLGLTKSLTGASTTGTLGSLGGLALEKSAGGSSTLGSFGSSGSVGAFGGVDLGGSSALGLLGSTGGMVVSKLLTGVSTLLSLGSTGGLSLVKALVGGTALGALGSTGTVSTAGSVGLSGATTLTSVFGSGGGFQFGKDLSGASALSGLSAMGAWHNGGAATDYIGESLLGGLSSEGYLDCHNLAWYPAGYVEVCVVNKQVIVANVNKTIMSGLMTRKISNVDV